MLLRGFQELYALNKDKQQLEFFIDDADRIWREEKNGNDLIGKKSKRKTLIDQAAMIEIYARILEMER